MTIAPLVAQKQVLDPRRRDGRPVLIGLLAGEDGRMGVLLVGNAERIESGINWHGGIGDHGSGVQGSGFRVQGSGFKVQAFTSFGTSRKAANPTCNMTTLTARFDDAVRYAHEVHREQTRKGTGAPYVGHLMGVTSIVLDDGGGEDEAIGALLHDAAEDHGGRARLEDIRTRFGDAVARIVEDCTDSWSQPKEPWLERKQAYIQHARRLSGPSLRVSAADKVHNSYAILRGSTEQRRARLGTLQGNAGRCRGVLRIAGARVSGGRRRVARGRARPNRPRDSARDGVLRYNVRPHVGERDDSVNTRQ